MESTSLLGGIKKTKFITSTRKDDVRKPDSARYHVGYPVFHAALAVHYEFSFIVPAARDFQRHFDVLLWRNLSPIAGQTHKKTDVNLLSRSEKLYFTQVPGKTIDKLAPRSVLPSTNHCCFYCCCYCTKIPEVNGHFLTPTVPIQCTDEASTGNDFQGKVSVEVSVVDGDKKLKVKTKVCFPEKRNGVERMGNDAIWIEAFVAHIVTLSP